jgi:hypothetical protein
MNRLKYVFGFVAMVATCSAAPPPALQFTNISLSTSPNLFKGLPNQLNSVVYGGNSNFVAVGANQIYVYGNFQPGQSWFTKSDWVTNQILPASGLNLASVTAGGNIFVASGDNNVVFSAPIASSSSLTWSQKAYIFGNSVKVPGLAYNGGGFAAAAAAPEIGWSSTNLPTVGNWLLGTLTNLDFGETFRGVTGYGANGFAICGRFGDVRLSSNGTNWQTAVSGLFGEPDLFGIASDGGQKLIAVGATNTAGSDNGIILVSTNSAHTNWLVAYVNPASSTPINAITYTGSGFIAVGNNGQVLTSPDGFNWTVQTNTGSANNLFGVAYANSGSLTGVGELVGASGTVILAGTPPSSPINGVGATNCASYPSAANNGTLSVALATDANHPAGTVTVDWYLQTNLVASGTTSFTPTNNPNLVTSNAPVTFTFNAVERDLRTGFTSAATPVTLEINPRPTTTLVPLNTTDCNVGDAFVLTNVLTGIGPWTVSWNDGTVQPASGTPPLTLTRTVFPTNTLPNTAVANIYYVTNVTSADTCLGNLPGDILGTNTITINPRPTAALTSFNTTDCDEGNPFPLNVTLTGIGPWTVFWNDGTVQSSATANLTRIVFPTNSFGANFPRNNIYFVTVVSNNDTCEGNEPGDITGTASIIINPLPTATLVPLNETNCNDGTPVLFTINLTGIGPWTVAWNDGTIQPSPLRVLTRMVSPTNTLANAASNNVYYVASVTDIGSGCIGNQPGDIAGTNSIVINPRPTATLAPLSITNCNNGSSFTLTNTLTGIGPWIVTWNDGLVQTNSQIVGPATLPRIVSPTNALANAASNNVYYLMSVADSTCVASPPGDITGTNLVVVNPLPTVTLTISTNDFFVSTNGVSSGLLETVSNTSGSTFKLTVGFQYLQNGVAVPLASQTLSVTNHLAFTGIGPWTVVLADGAGNTSTNTFSGNGNYVWQEMISTNSDTNFTFSVQSVQSTNTGCSGVSTASYDVLVYDAPTALVYTTNIFCGSATNIATISAVLGGFAPWTNVVWSDGFTNALVTSNPLNRTVPTPANGTLAQVISNYTIVSLTDMFGATTTSGNDLTGSAQVIVDPFSSNPPVALSSLNESCAMVPIPLSVTVPAGFTANWFDANTNLLTNGVTAYTPPAPALAATNIYLVAEIYNDTNLNDGCDSPFAAITNIFDNCSQTTSISLTGTNVVISWTGNFILQSTTNLLPPIMWMNVSTGALGPNFLTNPVSQPPIDFFRLTSPTN